LKAFHLSRTHVKIAHTEWDMGFIQVDQGTRRKTLRLARLLGEDRYTIPGRLVARWSWCLDCASSGSLAGIEPDILVDILGYVASRRNSSSR
jgi:hypothetical protein